MIVEDGARRVLAGGEVGSTPGERRDRDGWDRRLFLTTEYEMGSGSLTKERRDPRWLRYTRQEHTLKEQRMKVSGRRLNLTRTKEGSAYTRVKKSLKKGITRTVRRRLKRDLAH